MTAANHCCPVMSCDWRLCGHMLGNHTFPSADVRRERIVLCDHIWCLSPLNESCRGSYSTLSFFFFCGDNCLCFTLLTCQNQLAVSPPCVSSLPSTARRSNVITAAPYCVCQTLPCCPPSFITREPLSKLPLCFFFFRLLRSGLTFTSPP